MIGGLRRRFGSSNSDPWDANKEFEPEVDGVSEFPTDTAVLLAATRVTYEGASNNVDMKDYYRKLVQTAIEKGGTYNGQKMSVPWLRMILAGLEMRPIPPEAMWEGDETASPARTRPNEPAYEDLFPSERDPSG